MFTPLFTVRGCSEVFLECGGRGEFRVHDKPLLLTFSNKSSAAAASDTFSSLGALGLEPCRGPLKLFFVKRGLFYLMSPIRHVVFF